MKEVPDENRRKQNGIFLCPLEVKVDFGSHCPQRCLTFASIALYTLNSEIKTIQEAKPSLSRAKPKWQQQKKSLRGVNKPDYQCCTLYVHSPPQTTVCF